jgi:Resolvase, N terminal domain
MKDQTIRRSLHSAIYTRASTDQGLEQDFNSVDAQREACEAYIKSQAHEGWRLVRDRYEDGGYSGGSMVRPALQGLLADVEARRIPRPPCDSDSPWLEERVRHNDAPKLPNSLKVKNVLAAILPTPRSA